MDALAARLPVELTGLAEIAYNYRWSWANGGSRIFHDLYPHRWELAAENPVRLLTEASPLSLERAARDADLVRRANELLQLVREDGARPFAQTSIQPDRPAAFLCTEFAIHGSLPIYAGGLGVLAGDVLKEASDRALPYVGVGLLYRQGYFHQRVDASGWQHEYWTNIDPEMAPAVLVRDDDGAALTVTVPIRKRDVTVQIWRVNVGRVPLFLLDTYRPENELVDRWITSRLYVGDRKFRLAQYALLGLGGVRALRAMGIDPGVLHLNEGHVALAPLEVARGLVDDGAAFDAALGEARRRTIFTTHTPVAAGNEAYTSAEVLEILGDLPERLGADAKDVLALGRARPENEDEPFGMTPLGLRVSSRANAVSRKHGEVARGMWVHLYPDRDAVPIAHVTNGVHLPTWMATPLRALLDGVLGPDWYAHASDPGLWNEMDSIADADLWRVRCDLRADLVGFIRERAAEARLGRGEPLEYAEAAARAFDPDVLTLGFARRATGYKRLHLLTRDPERAVRLLEGPNPVQLALAGKPHPQDEEGKRLIQGVFALRWAPKVAEAVAFLEDYDLTIARRLVAGCDVWINVPRPPLEACGTSGMKAALNGGLNLSVMDGWWDEAYDGSNGWAIASHPQADHEAQDSQDSDALYSILENEAIPLFYDRGPDGVPHGWVAKVKASLRTIGPRFNATRMMDDYIREAYPFA